jgi:hypothetical protein
MKDAHQAMAVRKLQTGIQEIRNGLEQKLS